MKRLVCLMLALVMLGSVLVLPACSDDPVVTTTSTTTSKENPIVTTNPVTTTKNPDATVIPVPDADLYALFVDDMPNPVGIDNKEPNFSWKTNSDRLGWAQDSYQIVVKAGDTTVWDSGKVKSDKSFGIDYQGDTLISSTEYTWQVTVWDDKGAASASEKATFETGLLERGAFLDTNYISLENKNLYDGTTYTIDFDFIINEDNQGFCFGMKDTGTFVCWQVNASTGGDKVLLRPHFKSQGNWTAYPGGPGNVQAVDITAAVGYNPTEIVGKTVHERIEVNGRVVKTYFGKDENSLTLASTYTHSTTIPLVNIGFRHSSVSGAEIEIATYDNIVIRDKDGNTLYENDFSSGKLDFTGASHAALVDEALRVGTTGNVGENIYVRTSGDGLPAFRKEITVKNGLVSAKLYTSGLGVYESYVNGKRVGRVYEDGSVEYHELKPGFTEMADRKFYNTYDITSYLTEGKNALSAVVSKSWWSDAAANRFGKEDAYLAKLILTYSDGSKETVVTDTSWKTARASAVTYADIFTGESYDARISEDFMLAGFDDSDWVNAKINNEFTGEIVAWQGSYITVREDLERDPVSLTVFNGAVGATSSAYGKINVLTKQTEGAVTLKKGETLLVDFGQNFAGWECFTVSGKAGTILSVRHGEILNDNNGEHARGNDGPGGSIYNANYRSAKASTTYTLSGKGEETYHPSFTFYGFRYIEITATDDITIHKVSGQVVTSVDTDTGFMTTTDADINQLLSNIRWGQYSNYLSVPTDCPQRDERQGWTADTQVFAKAGSYFAYSKSFLEKFMTDMRDAQNSEGAYPGTAPTGAYAGAGWGGTGWADAGVIVPYTLYIHYGDTKVILENWDSMQWYVDEYLARVGGPQNIWGDWLAYESNDATIQSMLSVAFYAWDGLMMAEMAKAIGKDADAERYLALYEDQKQRFIETYVTSTGRLRRTEQSVCLYALYLNLLPDEKSYNTVLNQLTTNIKARGNKLGTGFLGTAIIMQTLTKVGRSDLAYTLLLQHDNPSWLYSVDQGATTIWERWNSYTIESGFGDVGMNSFNHYAYGAVGGWMFESMAGIGADPENPGFKNVLLAPQPDMRDTDTRLGCEATYDSPYGTIKASSQYEGDTWTYAFTLPANTTGTLTIPADSADITINGKAVSALTAEDGVTLLSSTDSTTTFSVVCGSFTVVTNLK
ncbi:MAG: family 78 glycoside hydrolase catalytic domain [Clostridia bacterium]|nr:family 78 glycoside hydrolase catalytic domain [Clostridia bacterium]